VTGSRRVLRYLAAYDDATLSRRRRRQLNALLARSPKARRELERQRAVRAALAAIDVQAPLALRARSFDGVPFPDWHGWHAVGARSGTVAGRASRTVFYEHEGHRLAYTVVAGAPLAPPDAARTVRANGATLRVYRDGDHAVVVFERNGRTCVLAGHVIHEETAIRLAAWKPTA
jgi:hypothetical protein